jgi:hypothetical protein
MSPIDHVQNDPGSRSAPLELLHGAGKRYGLFDIGSGDFDDDFFCIALSHLKKVDERVNAVGRCP